jgi:hypothetical protein
LKQIHFHSIKMAFEQIQFKLYQFLQIHWIFCWIQLNSNSNIIQSNWIWLNLNLIEPSSISFNWNEIQPNQIKLVLIIHWIFKQMQMNSLEFELNLSSIQIQIQFNSIFVWLNWTKIKIQFNLDCNLWNSWALQPIEF